MYISIDYKDRDKCGDCKRHPKGKCQRCHAKDHKLFRTCSLRSIEYTYCRNSQGFISKKYTAEICGVEKRYHNRPLRLKHILLFSVLDSSIFPKNIDLSKKQLRRVQSWEDIWSSIPAGLFKVPSCMQSGRLQAGLMYVFENGEDIVAAVMVENSVRFSICGAWTPY